MNPSGFPMNDEGPSPVLVVLLLPTISTPSRLPGLQLRNCTSVTLHSSSVFAATLCCTVAGAERAQAAGAEKGSEGERPEIR